MPPTIRDVAAAAGVSITTVSHVLSGQGRISEATRRRVAKAAADLGYQANIHAQQLVTRRSRTLAIQLANSVEATTSSALVPNSDYFLEVLNGAAEAATGRSYALLLTPPDADLEALDAFAVDGAILVDPRGDEPFFATGWSRNRPLVTTGRPLARKRRVPVVVDNDLMAAARLMLDHLAGNGYRRPALITTDTSRSYTADLVAGYREWCTGHAVTPQVVELDEPPTTEGAATALGRLLDQRTPPDAIFTTSENLALGVLHEAQRRGLAVPAGLGICSAVDSGALQLTSPQVTGMFVYPREVGRQAAIALMDLIDDGPRRTTRRIEIPVRLNARASTLRGTPQAG
ncbi:LacI family DNA-binding transcriptional regulator [Amycolatopsis viridis]|uniref:DNA-binding LacI/PurR family transcriptional regulator n=1 Tax=Amycolatopsis viridis TaxID=185678 RepID=A0ABX0SWI0_9PSEU|nr:LacI family DNA-binding transcriptional regulator [Amycolatopsis viridis]NIH79686.1 DNA-binding LacI/PurR family transcriptional regulator [Amycolatopsis viridis]